MLLGFARQMVAPLHRRGHVVTGHLRLSSDHMVNGARHFSPGAVFVNEMLTGRPHQRPDAWAYRRYRKRIPDGERLPAIGFVEAGPGRLTARRVVLERPIAVQRRRAVGGGGSDRHRRRHGADLLAVERTSGASGLPHLTDDARGRDITLRWRLPAGALVLIVAVVLVVRTGLGPLALAFSRLRVAVATAGDAGAFDLGACR